MLHKIKDAGLNWSVASAGTEYYHIGEPPHPYSQKICKENGIDISDIRATKFTKDSFDHYDVIYAMAHDVYKEIQRIGGRQANMHKVRYFLNELYEDCNGSVPDPFNGPEKEFAMVYKVINNTCDAIIQNNKKEIYV
jgi:protein-tyrosine phosphatase